jgi:O-antigen ligase
MFSGFGILRNLIRGILLYILLVNTMDNLNVAKFSIWIILVGLSIATLYGIFWFKAASYSMETIHGFIRVRGFGADPNNFAVAIMGGLPFVFISFLRKKGIYKLLMLGLLVFLIVGIVLSYSRSGVVALLVVFFGILWLERRRPLVWIIIIATLTIGLILVPPNFIYRMLLTVASAQDDSISIRLDLWQAAWKFFTQYPITGIGIGQFIALETRITHHMEPLVVHNMYLEVLAELGIVGFIAFMTIIWLSFSSFIQAARRFERSGDESAARLSWGWFYSLMAFCIAGVFLSNQYYIVFWFYLAMGEVLKRLSK